MHGPRQKPEEWQPHLASLCIFLLSTFLPAVVGLVPAAWLNACASMDKVLQLPEELGVV